MMDMLDEWLSGLRLWASQNDNIPELWLFGSRAKRTSRPQSDVDIAIALVPAMGFQNWLTRIMLGIDGNGSNNWKR
jgi:predicted nucleotidyltransferase